MSRTREIEVWIHKNVIVNGVYEKGSKILPLHEYPNCEWVEAKLIIELPERKVTISESEFDEAWARNTGTTFSELRERLKEKFFKDA